MPRSPWLASAGCTKNAGVPVEAVEQRLRGLVAAGRVVIEEREGQRVARVATP